MQRLLITPISSFLAVGLFISSVFFFLAPKQMPYEYYVLLRFVAMYAFGVSILVCYTRRSWFLLIIAIIGALLFNPIAPVSFSKGDWFLIDIAAGIYLVVVGFKMLDKSDEKAESVRRPGEKGIDRISKRRLGGGGVYVKPEQSDDSGIGSSANEGLDKRNKKKKESYEEYLKSERWARLRQQIQARDRCQCQDCGAGSNLEVHHLTYDRRGNELLSDLVLLCRSCHKFRHGIEEPKTQIDKQFKNQDKAVKLFHKFRHGIEEFKTKIVKQFKRQDKADKSFQTPNDIPLKCDHREKTYNAYWNEYCCVKCGWIVPAEEAGLAETTVPAEEAGLAGTTKVERTFSKTRCLRQEITYVNGKAVSGYSYSKWLGRRTKLTNDQLNKLNRL